VRSPNVSLELYDSKSQYHSETFDVICGVDVLHHLGDPARRRRDVGRGADHLVSPSGLTPDEVAVVLASGILPGVVSNWLNATSLMFGVR